MNERQLLGEILIRAERTERRVRNIQFRGIRMERKIMTLQDDVTTVKADVANLIAAFNQSKTDIQMKIDAAVAADEAGTDVDIKQLHADITAALASGTAATEAAAPPAA